MKSFNKMAGMTLIEIMIVVVVIGILASIAYPAYTDQMMKSRRTDGQVALMQAVSNMERHYTNFGRYSGTLANSGISSASPEGHYNISIATIPAGGQTYTLRAVPQGVQATDGDLEINNLGVKSPSAKW